MTERTGTRSPRTGINTSRTSTCSRARDTALIDQVQQPTNRGTGHRARHRVHNTFANTIGYLESQKDEVYDVTGE